MGMVYIGVRAITGTFVGLVEIQTFGSAGNSDPKSSKGVLDRSRTTYNWDEFY